MAIAVGEIVDGVVTGIAQFGAFVELPGGSTGLVHISEISESYVENIHDHLKRGDKVRVKILSIDASGKKIGLSIRQALPGASAQKPRGGGGRGPGRPKAPQTFEDKLQRFMKDSEDRLGDLKKVTQERRGGRGSHHPKGMRSY
ncbi:MAG: S1 RNA-binding domain-containing protein [Bacillota bacterium]|nr:S1 RNA-binding domain-containing protein [Bacillota bacterium]